MRSAVTASVADAARTVLACGADFDVCVGEIRKQRGLPSDDTTTCVVASAEGLSLHLSDSRGCGYVGVRASTSGRSFEAGACRNGVRVRPRAAA